MTILDTHGHLVSPEPNSGCWLWAGAATRDGYGKVTVKRKTQAAHRLSWDISEGGIPAGLHVLHKCDVKLCVNPEHLFVGTHGDNMQDALLKGRLNPHSEGEANPSAKLTWEEVNKIRKDCRSLEEVANEFQVSDTTISHIRNNKQWRVA